MINDPCSEWEEVHHIESEQHDFKGFTKKIADEKFYEYHVTMNFPTISADQFWKMTTDLRKRALWDYNRLFNAEFIGPGENDGTIIYLDSSIQKEKDENQQGVQILNTWTDETNFGKGIRAFIQSTVEHVSKPLTDESAFESFNSRLSQFKDDTKYVKT